MKKLLITAGLVLISSTFAMAEDVSLECENLKTNLSGNFSVQYRSGRVVGKDLNIKYNKENLDDMRGDGHYTFDQKLKKTTKFAITSSPGYPFEGCFIVFIDPADEDADWIHFEVKSTTETRTVIQQYNKKLKYVFVRN